MSAIRCYVLEKENEKISEGLKLTLNVAFKRFTTTFRLFSFINTISQLTPSHWMLKRKQKKTEIQICSLMWWRRREIKWKQNFYIHKRWCHANFLIIFTLKAQPLKTDSSSQSYLQSVFYPLWFDHVKMLSHHLKNC